MIISLIGMSGSGKTFWSKQLSNQGFIKYCCDDLIESRLSDELKKLGFSGIADVSKWMGQPYDQRYKNTSKKYLDLETKVVKQILSELEKINLNKNIVIDTTGSVIYIEPEILKLLSRNSKIIYLEVPQAVKDEMFRLYLLDPKPVIWGQSYQKSGGQSDYDSLKNSYPGLLKYRSKKYHELADVTLDYFQLRKKDFNVGKFLGLIK